MDWAIQAARKKNKRLPGGSRSVVETLNVFNDVVTEGDLEINRVLNSTGKWIKEIGSGLNGQLSPEKTVKIGNETVVKDIPGDKTPQRTVNLPSETPKSLPEEPVAVAEAEQEREPEAEPAPLPQHKDRFAGRRRTTTRRSNVFVPLPNKDPLVVQAAPEPASGQAAVPPVPPQLPQMAPPLSVQSSTALSSPASAASPTATSASHRRRRAIATATSAPKSNVFDRLSSIPTKSFENKVNRTARKGSSASSIDVTGSPMRRSSPKRNPGGVVDSSIQETLKNIFSTQPGDSISNGKVTKRDPLASHLPRSINRRNNFKPSAAKSPAREHSPQRQTRKPPLMQQAPQPTRNHQYDRLTRFQLLPPVESEKDDLKEKLDKRLTEVVRTQQEQHKRKQEQQKRKSHLEEDFKRRTKLWSDATTTATTTATNTNKTVGSNPLQQLDKNNTILHDLYIADHRTILGETNNTAAAAASNAHATDVGGGIGGAGNHDDFANQSLPYIHSDSEEEEDVTLAPWARSPYLQRQLHLQQNWDPKKIFGPIPPLHIDQIFQNSRLNRLKPKKG